MGLLDQDQWGALGLLGQGISNRNFSGGANAAIGYLDQQGIQAGRNRLLDAQLQETLAQADERRMRARKEQEALEQSARLQSALPGLFKQPGMTGGEAMPQTTGGMPMFSQPMSAGPMQSTPGGFDVQKAVRLGMPPKMIEEYAALSNIGRQKVARTVKGMGPDGREFEYQVDEFGQRVGDGMPQWKAPHYQDLGGQVGVFDGYGNRTGGLGKSQSPDSVASNALGYSRLGEEKRHNGITEGNAAQTLAQGRAPAGYRVAADGKTLEFIPGGPADPAAAKKAAPTEFQGKSTTFGARMTDAARVLDDLEGKVNPSQVAQAGYKANFPAWLPGGQMVGAGLEAANRSITPDDAQRYRQAQENWVTANLRQESGAAIGKEEMEKDIRKWFAQPNEPDSVKAQKAASRKVAERAMIVQAGPGASSIASIVDGTPPPTQGSGVHWRYVNGKLVKAE